MQRDTEDEKTDYTLILDGPMLERWATHLTKGAKKYAARNWMKAAGDAELQRFRRSAIRHFLQWMRGDTDEDHASAVFFNINGAAYVEAQIKQTTEVKKQYENVKISGTPLGTHPGQPNPRYWHD